MTIGWIRAYDDEQSTLEAEHDFVLRSHRTAFRKKFRTELWSSLSQNASVVRNLRWGDVVELPDGLSNDEWTRVRSGTKEGFVASAHVVEVAHVGRKFEATMELREGGSRKLLWGDLVQITKRGTTTCDVWARGSAGTVRTSDLTDEALLEVYFVDVGQGDGLLVRTPDGRHLMIDGGLERTKQLTGKNAADFVDWKFFFDYGDHRIRLDGLMASHSDNDHYGGLHDLVRKGSFADRELDCDGVDVAVFHHPGLSRWSNRPGAPIAHRQGLGPFKDGAFVRLLDDRDDAEAAVEGSAGERLSGPWQRFVRDVLENARRTRVERVLVERESVVSGGALPRLWPGRAGCDVFVLAPVATSVGGEPALPDFGRKSFNTNGHSICLRIDYGRARILLTGDLNKASMEWLADCYGDRMGAWECDVAKACHHGSHDVSYRFLERICAAATVISSGDAEGHAHPRPEIVGASARTGFVSVDREHDRLITPLVYMTEIERSVSLGALNRIDVRGLPRDGEEIDVAVPARHLDEMNDKAFLTPEARRALARLPDGQDPDDFVADVAREQKPVLAALEDAVRTGEIDVDFNLTVPRGPVASDNVRKRAWRSRIMEKNHYGLVNVRTDGETILCATLGETEKKWGTHAFPARFGSTDDD